MPVLPLASCLLRTPFFARSKKGKSSLMQAQTNERKRLDEYRQYVRSKNFLGSVRVFWGAVGLFAMFLLGLTALVRGTEGGLFAGSMGQVSIRFGKFGFFLACLWGLFPGWCNYSEKNARECLRRKETLERMEQGSNPWHNREGQIAD